jgi:hypothetical protein
MESGKWKTEIKRSKGKFRFFVFYFLISLKSSLLLAAAFLLIARCLPLAVYAQKQNSLGWVWQNPLPQGNPLYAVHFAGDKATGFAVGADGTILRTEDGGFNWQAQKSASAAALSGVFVKDKSLLFEGVAGNFKIKRVV